MDTYDYAQVILDIYLIRKYLNCIALLFRLNIGLQNDFGVAQVGKITAMSSWGSSFNVKIDLMMYEEMNE